MKKKQFRLVVGVLTSAAVLVACGDGALNEGNGPGNTFDPSNPGGQVNPGGPNTASPTTPSTPPGAPVNTTNPATPGAPVNEGAPPVTTGVNGGTPTGGTPTGGTPTGGTPTTPAGETPTATPTPVTPTPVTPAVPARPADVEATNCNIPTPSARPIGYGQNTTGGGNAAPVIVNSFEAAQAALTAYREAFGDGLQNALVLRYTGSFDYGTITDVCAQHTKAQQLLSVKEMDNVTLEGAPGSTANFGIHINRAHNVIVRNMTLGLLPGADGSDAITIEGNNINGDVENVWIDHNELFSSTKDDCPGAGDTEFDGLIDVKKGARFITISYNHLHDHQKTGLMGFSDTDETERYVTFHHNYYENVVSRTPLQRFGFVHIFNNYYNEILDSGINVRMNGVALIESNFFENAANPITSRFTDVAGFWDLRNNHVGPGITWDVGEDTLANADNWQSTTTFPDNELTYTYTPDEPACVKQIVRATAGAIL